jgi:hypothetical protein
MLVSVSMTCYDRSASPSSRSAIGQDVMPPMLGDDVTRSLLLAAISLPLIRTLCWILRERSRRKTLIDLERERRLTRIILDRERRKQSHRQLDRPRPPAAG